MKQMVLFAGVAVGVGTLLTAGALMGGWAALSGKSLLWVSDERGAFILVAALGFMACTAVMWLGLQPHSSSARQSLALLSSCLDLPISHKRDPPG
jgi:hypothetical protein